MNGYATLILDNGYAVVGSIAYPNGDGEDLLILDCAEDTRATATWPGRFKYVRDLDEARALPACSRGRLHIAR